MGNPGEESREGKILQEEGGMRLGEGGTPETVNPGAANQGTMSDRMKQVLVAQHTSAATVGYL